MNIEELVSEYVALRDKKSEVTAKAKELVGKLEDKMSNLEAEILKAMGDGVESVRTKAGTAYKSTKRSTSVAGWDDFLPWVQQTDNWHMLTKAANKTAVLEFLDEHEELPPGINLYSELTININRPTRKAA